MNFKLLCLFGIVLFAAVSVTNAAPSASQVQEDGKNSLDILKRFLFSKNVSINEQVQEILLRKLKTPHFWDIVALFSVDSHAV